MHLPRPPPQQRLRQMQGGLFGEHIRASDVARDKGGLRGRELALRTAPRVRGKLCGAFEERSLIPPSPAAAGPVGRYLQFPRHRLVRILRCLCEVPCPLVRISTWIGHSC
jgi:hypothetical protein